MEMDRVYGETAGVPGQDWVDLCDPSSTLSNGNVAACLLGMEPRACATRVPPHVALRQPLEMEAHFLI